MRVLEIITESKKQQQIDELDLKKVGTAIGKGVSATTQGIGAVAGGVAGIPKAFKKGFQAGKDIVGGSDSVAKTAKNRTFQYTDPKTKEQSAVTVDDKGQYFITDKSGQSRAVTAQELPNVSKQDPAKKPKTTSGSSASTVSSNVTSTVDPQKLTLKQIKQAVDKMRKRDRDSLISYLQSKNTPATSSDNTASTASTAPKLSVAV